MLIRLLEVSGEDVADHFEGTDPFIPAAFPVAWAGETRSPMWFDVAREYTERWHQKRQIADTVSRPTPIVGPGLDHPALDTSLRALPFTSRDVVAPRGTTVRVRIVGAAGGDRVVDHAVGGWSLLDDPRDFADATAWIDQADACKLFTERRDRAAARASFPGIRVEGMSCWASGHWSWSRSGPDAGETRRRSASAMDLLSEEVLERSAVVANGRRNRERGLADSNGYDRDEGDQGEYCSRAPLPLPHLLIPFSSTAPSCARSLPGGGSAKGTRSARRNRR